MKATLRSILVMMLAAAMVLAALPVFAQDGLSEDEMDLLTRFVEVEQMVDSYDSFVETRVETESQDFEIALEGTPIQSQVSETMTEKVNTIVRGDAPSASSVVTVTSTIGEDSSVIEGELRYVDGVWYGRASIVEGTSFYVFEEGWVEIADLATIGDLGILEPESLLELLEASEENPLDDIDMLTAAVTSVSSEMGEIDGQEVEIITLTIGIDGLFDVLAATDSAGIDPEDPMMGAMMTAISEESGVTASLAIGADGNPVQLELHVNMIIADLDAGELDPSAAGMVVNMTLELSQVATLSDVNAAEAVTAPEM